MQWLLAQRLFDGIAPDPRPDMAVAVADGRIAAVLPAAEASAGAVRVPILAPGFVDLQINGGDGLLFNDAPTPETIARIAAAARQGGTAHLLPTFITDAGQAYRHAIAAVATACAAGVPGILGVHLEGPFLSPERPGIHPARHIRPLMAEDATLISTAPCRVLLTLAPEAQDPALLEGFARAGVHLFAGHSAAGWEEMARAADLGLGGVTHLFNAMSQLQGREPGVVGAALGDTRLAAGIIADGHHVHPANLRLAAQAMGARLFLVTDAMATLASDLAGFDLFGVPVRLEGGRLVSPEGTLAGAHLAMDQAVRRMVRLAGVTPAAALAMASGNAARALGLGAELGRIAPGWRASLTCLDADLHALGVMVDGAWPDGPPAG